MKAHLPGLAIGLRVVCISPLLIGAAVSTVSAQEWECQQCPGRSVAVFDVAHPEPTSDVTLLTGEYLGMQMADGGLLTHLLQKDPSRECINFTSAVFTQTDASGADNHNFGQGGVPGLPPGAVPGADYVVSGEIAADDDGNYVLTVRLQAGGTREEVASGSVAWDLEAGATVSTAQAAESLMPLMAKIRAFEKRKRDTMTAVAIRPDRGMDVIPDPQVVGRGGTSEVTIRLTDCDGVRLKNRIVAPTGAGGIMVPPEMPVTDGNGEMKVSFSLFDTEKRGTVFAEHHYVPPFSARDERGVTAETVITAGENLVWVRIRKQLKIRRWHDNRGKRMDQWEKFSRGSSEEVIDVEVQMTPDFTTVEVEKEFDIANRRFIPREYSYEVVEEDPPQITRNIFRTAYTNYERSWDGKDVLDSSGQSFGRFKLDGMGSRRLMFRVDASGQVTHVSLPGVALISDYEHHTSCTKIVNGETEDCSNSAKYSKLLSMGPDHPEDDCYVPKEQDRVRIAGGCRWARSDAGRGWREETEWDWSVIAWGRQQ